MSKGNTFENDFLKLIFQAIAIADLAENDTTSPATNLYVSLHTADPGEGGDQTTSEAAYTSYARVAVARTSGGWTVTNNEVVNAAAITFPACTGLSETEMFWAIGTASSGAGKVLYSGPLTGGAAGALGPFVAENSTDQVTIKGHGLSVDDRITFVAPPSATLPTGISAGTVYWVKTVPDADNVTLSTTQGGATLDITADGDGLAYKVVGLAVSNGITPQFNAGQLIVDED